MKRSAGILVLSLAAAAAAGSLRAQSPAAGPAIAPDDGSSGAALLLQEGFFHEVALNDLERAIEIYGRALEFPGISARRAAEAHLRRGICLHLLGRWGAAEKDFLAVTENSSADAAAAETARRYLGIGSSPHPALFMPPETQIYSELVNPAGQIAFISELIRGTPLENPVDYYLSAAAREDAPDSRLPRPSDRTVAFLRAILNQGFLREFQRIEGFAVGFPSIAVERPEFLVVFQPGNSGFLRGMIKTVIASSMEAMAAKVEGMTIFQMRREAPRGGEAAPPLIFTALDPSEKVLLVGTPLELVEEAIRRQHAGGASPSLAAAPDFREAQAARAGSLIFTYLQGSGLIDGLRTRVPEDLRGGFDLLRAILGVDHLRSVSAALSRSGDDFRLALRCRIDPAARPVWDAVRTPVLEPEILQSIPPGCLGFAALSLTDLPQRRQVIAEAVARVVPEFPARLNALLGEALEPADDDAARRRMEALLSRLHGLALVFTEEAPAMPGIPFPFPFYVAVGLRGGGDDDSAIEELLGRIAWAAFRNRASTRFRELPPGPGEIEAAGRIRAIEPSPGWFAGYARSGDYYLIAPAAAALEPALRRIDSGSAFPREKAPVAASKVIWLRPAAIAARLRESRRGIGDPNLARILESIPEASIHTLESASGLSLELAIPGAAPILHSQLLSLSPIESPERPPPQPEGAPEEKK